MSRVYRLLTEDEWQRLLRLGEFGGNALDQRDGYVHLSLPHQVLATWERHCRGLGPLRLLGLDAAALGSALRMEDVRGQWFPHLYAPLSVAVVRSVERLPAR